MNSLSYKSVEDIYYPESVGTGATVVNTHGEGVKFFDRVHAPSCLVWA
jgi:hypothetical protein